MYDQFAPTRPDPPMGPDLPPFLDVFASLREILPALEQADVQVQMEVVNTRTDEIGSTIRVGDVLRVRTFLTGLDQVFEPTNELRSPLMSLLLVSAAATEMSYDSQILTAFRAVRPPLDNLTLLDPTVRMWNGELFESQFVAMKAGTTTLATQFHGDPVVEGRRLFSPLARDSPPCRLISLKSWN